MKKTILLFLFLGALIAFSAQAGADPWDNLTLKQAEDVVNYLKENRFILDYCDCCGEGDIYLLKVISTDIVPCQWDTKQKSVKVKAVRIGRLERLGAFPSAHNTAHMKEKVEYTITMNYTFVYSECGNWAVPFFKVVDYNQVGVCCGATQFPNPAHNEISDQDYFAWFVKKGMK